MTMREGAYNPEHDRLVAKGEQCATPDVLSGEEVADIAALLYNRIPERYRTHLVDANVVLTLAGAKPLSEFFVTVRDDAALEKVKRTVEQWNILLQQQGLPMAFSLEDEPFIAPTGKRERTQMIGIINMRGLRRMLATTSLLGAERLQPPETWEEYPAWKRVLQETIVREQASGKLPKEVDPEVIVEGLERGYPDVAIVDFALAHVRGSDEELEWSETPLLDKYEGAKPKFAFAPEHATDPSVQKAIEENERILQEFYSSAWHQQVERDPAFLQERAQLDREEA